MSLASGQIDLTWTEQDGMTRTLKAVNLDASVVPDPSIPVLPTPSITGVDPASGTAGGHVWLTGDFTGVTDVAFGTVSASGLAVIDSSTIELVVPEGLSGQIVQITATNRWAARRQATSRSGSTSHQGIPPASRTRGNQDGAGSPTSAGMSQ